MAGARSFSVPSNVLVKALISGVAWDSQTITFSLPSTGVGWGEGYPRDVGFDPDGPGGADPIAVAVNETSGFVPLNVFQGGVVLTALTEVESFTNLAINRAFANPLTADLRFAMTTTPTPNGTVQNPLPGGWTAYGYYPGTGVGGDAWFNTVSYLDPALGTYAHQTIYHEIGHTLGLKHPHPETVGTTPNAPVLPEVWDSLEFTTMTYREAEGSAPGDGYSTPAGRFPQSFMMLDIQALQLMYGADYTTNAGETVWRFDPRTGETSRNGTRLGPPDDGGLPNTPPVNILFRTIWDGGGNDTYDFSDYTTRLSVNLAPGKWSDTDRDGNAQAALLDVRGASTAADDVYARGQVFNALLYDGDTRSLIENARGGSGDDVMLGNQAGNRLEGNGGRDFLVGLLGHDMLLGGEGNDTLNGDDGADVLVGGAGADVMNGGADTDRADYSSSAAAIALDLIGFFPSSGDAAGDRFVSVEGFLGTDFADTMSGTGGGEFLDGWFGSDVLSGRGGDDALQGGFGDDTLAGGAGADSINGGEGYDTAVFNEAAVLLNLTTGIHGGEAAGDAYALVERFLGGDGDDTMTGDGGAQDFAGGGGNDLLEGGGGMDRLYGGLGNDTLRGDAGDDTLFGGGGNDVYEGGTGYDRVSFADFAVGVSVDLLFNSLGGGGVGTFRLFSIEDFEGSDYADAFYGRANQANYFYGGGGNDTLAGRGGGDVLDGEENDDVLLVVGGELSARGGFGGFDTLAVGGTAGAFDWNANSFTVDGTDIFQVLDIEMARGGAGGDVFRANGDNLSFYGEDGNDTLVGGAGDNVLEGAAGADAFVFGAGYDYADYRSDTAGVIVDIAAVFVAGGHAAGDSWSDRPEGLLAGAGDDRLGGSAGDNRILGRAGADYLSGYAGLDTLDGGEGNDSIEGGAGADLALGGDGADEMVDTLGILLPAGVDDGADDTLLGGAGDDTITAGAGADSLDGGTEDDVLGGGAGADVVSGGTGNDALSDHTQRPAFAGASPPPVSFAGTDADTLSGGIGDDWIYASGGGDVINGGAGVDNLVMSFGGEAAGLLFTYRTIPWVVTLGGTVAATVQEVEGISVTGGAGRDVMNGTLMAFAATFDGGAGNDALRGGASGDVLVGSSGNDLLAGNGGDDLLVGGLGRDTLAGGAGSDLFRWDGAAEGRDVIQGFVTGEDRLWIDASGFRGRLVEGMDLAATGRFVLGSVATQEAGQFLYDGGSGALLWDADGTRERAPVLIATLDPGTALAAGDFVVVA